MFRRTPPAELQRAANGRYSLRRRLVLAFGVLLILFMGLAGLVLDRAFKQSVAASVRERLQLQVYALVSVAEPEGEGFFLPDLEEARYRQLDSGLYGFIFDSAGRELWRSPSALSANVDAEALGAGRVPPGQTLFGELDSEQSLLSFANYGTYWPTRGQQYSFVVLESAEPTAAEIRQFQSSLWFWLGGLALLLSLIQYFLLRWGLLPLQRLAHDVSRIESGDSDQLGDDYPAELQAVSQNLNLLIRSERERQGRYRSTLGDLAHSLKTPLAVISGLVRERGGSEAGGADPQLREIAEQVERMDQIVSWQLRRAVKSHTPRLLARQVAVAPVLEKILGALAKVYRDKDVQVTRDLRADARFAGDEGDLMELAGNLLDNAFKYGQGRVSVSARRQGRCLLLEVGDDGPGIAEAQRHWVLQRGARADTLKSGQGIGLTVAADIVSAYGGEMRLDSSPLGGALFTVLLDE